MLIDMSGNRNLTLLDRSFNNMEKLKILWLQVNGLIALPEDLIWGSFQLQFIDLRKNYLESLPKHVFRDAINLKTLLLKSNNIKVLSDYIFKNTNLLEELDLSHNRITSISRNLFNGLHALKELYMEQNHLRTISFESFSSLKSLKVAIFSNNHLTLQSTFFYPNIVPKSPFHYCRSLKELYLSHNNISDIIFNGLSSTIQILELHSNNISKIRPVLKFLRNSTNLIYLTLYDNPWECNCDAVDFLHFIHTEYREITKISKVSQVICHGINKSVSDMSFYDFCPLDTTAIIIISVLITLTGFIICILGLYYKYQKHIKIWLFAHEWCLRFVTEEQLDKEKSYDAFVSYSHNDHSFIINELIPKLENGPTPYKLCLHYRDCSIYECVSDVIAKSVTNSRRTIVILSPNFLDSVWGKMEFRVSHCQALSEGRAKVILIFYDDIGPINDLDAELKAIITMSTCIQWGDSWFWDKLKYALPHQSIRPKSIVEREVVESGEL
nr:PREDICTED: protein toll-like [Linepithema humile]